MPTQTLSAQVENASDTVVVQLGIAVGFSAGQSLGVKT
jgi:hypothetical protein